MYVHLPIIGDVKLEKISKRNDQKEQQNSTIAENDSHWKVELLRDRSLGTLMSLINEEVRIMGD